jgi:amidophosphoribosyltransferase
MPTTPRGMSSVNNSLDYVIASESVAIDTLGFTLVRDVNPGEVIFIDMKGDVHTKQCHPTAKLSPCIFEYVYFARPDSIMDGVSVYQSRLLMGEMLAKNIKKRGIYEDIDVVIPIPDTSRTSALQAAYELNCPFREGFIKNRYIARTFIMPGQESRKKSVRLKLNTMKSEFAGKVVLLVDDSIVRGTTAREIVQMARDAGAKKVYFSSAAPPIRYPNIYGIDIPTRSELVAYEREEHEVAKHIGADAIIYQTLEDLETSIKNCCADDAKIEAFDTSCFSGNYVTGQHIGDDYFNALFASREDENNNNSGGVKVALPPNASIPELMKAASIAKGSGEGASIPELMLSRETSSAACESVMNDESQDKPVDGEDGFSQI